MMELLDTASLPLLAPAVLAVLLDVTVKGVLILSVAGLLTTLLKRASAATRHLIWSLAVCSVLVLPLLTVVLPAWRLPVHAGLASAYEAGMTPDDAAVAPAGAPPGAAALPPVSAPDAPAPAPAVVPVPEGRVRATEGPLPAFYESILSGFTRLYEAAGATHWTLWLLIVWLGGLAVGLIRFVIGAAGVWWLSFRARPLVDPAWDDLSGEVTRRMHLARPVRLLRSLRTAMPMTWGLWRPVVLLPAGARDWSVVRRRCVLTHEFAHIKRWDCLTQTLAQLACALYWFNPLVWVGARRMRQEREMACDDYVLAGSIKPSDYASHLLDIARTTRSTLVAPLSAVSMARPSQLEGRVVAILDAARRRGRPGRRAAAAGVLLTAALVVPLAAIRPAAPEAEATEDEMAFVPISSARGEAYRWTGAVGKGKTVEIRGFRGDVQATPATAGEVEVVAVFEGEGDAQTLLVMEHAEGLVVCMPPPQHPGSCDGSAWGRHGSDAPAVDFLVLIPEGVHFTGKTVRGDVRVVGLQGNVTALAVDGDVYARAAGVIRAETEHGDIDLGTQRYGQAATVQGDIRARIGRTDWNGRLSFQSVEGDVSVELPAGAHTDIDLHVEASGRLSTALPLQHHAQSGGTRYRGRLGRGGRLLALHTIHGDVTVTYAGEEAPRRQESFDVRMQDETRPPYRADAAPRTPWIDAFSQRREEERVQAVLALAREETDQVVGTLSYVVVHDPSADVRASTARALGDVGCDQALPALFAALEDDDAGVRHQVVAALGAIAGRDAVPALSRVLVHDPSSDVRREAAWALGALEDERAVEALRQALRDADPHVRRQAADALDAFGLAEAAVDAHKGARYAETPNLRLRVGDLDLKLPADVLDLAVGLLSDLGLNVRVDHRDLEHFLQERGVQQRFNRQMRRLGFEEASDGELLVARMLGVEPAYLQALQQAGYCPSLQGLLQLKMAGVEVSFVEEMVAEGYAQLPVEALIAMHASGAHRVEAGAPEEGWRAPAVEEVAGYPSPRGPSASSQPELRWP